MAARERVNRYVKDTKHRKVYHDLRLLSDEELKILHDDLELKRQELKDGIDAYRARWGTDEPYNVLHAEKMGLAYYRARLSFSAVQREMSKRKAAKKAARKAALMEPPDFDTP